MHFSQGRECDTGKTVPCEKSKYRPVFELVDERPAGAFGHDSNLISASPEEELPRLAWGGPGGDWLFPPGKSSEADRPGAKRRYAISAKGKGIAF